MNTRAIDAWNNFVFQADPMAHPRESERRKAALACKFMSLANNGGLNGFLTNTWDWDAHEVLNALETTGAVSAAAQLGRILEGIGIPLPAMSEAERWDILEKRWTDEFDDLDRLSDQSDKELMSVLERHVAADEDYYLSLDEPQ